MKLKELGTIITGNTPSKKNREYYDSRDISFFKPSDFSSNNVELLEVSEEYISETAREKARILPRGAILVTCIGVIGKVGVLQKEATCNQQINAIIPNVKVNERYLAYAIRSKQNWLQKKANAPVVPIINKTDFSEIDVKIYNLEEQIAIVRKLDKIREVISAMGYQLECLDNLVKSQFVKMFGRPFVNEMGWKNGTIKHLIKEAKYGTSRPSNEGGKYKYLRMNNITYSGELDLSDIKYIDIPENEIERCVAQNGDILFNRTNSRELVGKTCVYNLDERMVIAGFIIRVRTNELANPYFISTYLNTKYLKNKLYSMCKNASGQSNINAQELQNIEIYVPPIELQNQFADFVRHIDKQKFTNYVNFLK